MKQFTKQMGEWILIRVIGGLAFMLALSVMFASFGWGMSNGIF